MKFFLGFAVICFVTVIVQALAEGQSARHMDVVNTRLSTCDLSDVWSKFGDLLSNGVYSLADIVISMEGSLYETVTCAESGFLGFWKCSYEVWTQEFASIQENFSTCYLTAQNLFTDIVQDFLTCVNL